MIITVTPNPAVDQTVFVDDLHIGGVNRFSKSQLDPAGKGINVSRMVHRLGWPTIAFSFLAGEVGLIVREALDSEGVQYHCVFIPGQTRINVTVVNASDGTATSLFGPGPTLPRESLTALEGLLQFWVPAGRVLVLAGSLPPGVPDDLHASYVRLAQANNVKAILDADGEAFRLGVEARPYLIKPNVEEAERLLSRRLPDLEAVVRGARELAARGISVVAISMGARGTVCASGDRTWLAIPPEVERRSTVGSGDSLVAGLAVALARGDEIDVGLRLGTAAGAATAMSSGTALGTAEEVRALLPRVQVSELS